MKATYNKFSEFLRRELSKNLAAQQKRMGKVSIKQLSSVCHASSTTVERWFKGESLPDLPNLIMLADYFGCSAANLIEPETDISSYLKDQPGQFPTYVDQMYFFLQMISSPYTKIETIKQVEDIIASPIVAFLVKTFYKNLNLVRECGVSGTELQSWLDKVSKDFEIPVSPATPDRIKEVLNQNRTLDLYADFLRTARYLHDHAAEEQMEKAEFREEANRDWLDPSVRIPSPGEFRLYPDFYGTADEYF